MLWVITQAWVDANHLNNRQYFSNHADRFVSRLIIILIFTSISIKLAFFGIAAFWLIFDLSLNLFRKLPWDYVGTEAKTDKFFRNRMWLYYTTKLIALLWLLMQI